MRADTITRAQAQLPATREEMEQRLGLKPGSCRHVVQHMLSKGYAKEWGDKLTSRGTLVRALSEADQLRAALVQAAQTVWEVGQSMRAAIPADCSELLGRDMCGHMTMTPDA